MMLSDRLRALAEALPDDGSVSFTRDDLLAMLAAADAPPGAAKLTVDLTVAEVARLLGRAAGTVRGWCASGDLAGAYRFNGREWRIPPTAIALFQRKQAGVDTATKHDSTRAAPEANLRAWRSFKAGEHARVSKTHLHRASAS